MKPKPIYTFIFSLFCFFNFAQQDSAKISKTKFIAFDQIFLSLDLFDPAMSIFSNKKGGKAQLTFHINKKFHAAIEAGYEQNAFDDLGWIADAKGTYFKAGFIWFTNLDAKNRNNGFHLGSRIATSQFTHHISQFPVFSINDDTQQTYYSSFPSSSLSAYWFEFSLGGRIKLFDFPLYADFMLQPKIFITSTQDNNAEPLVIPGYGKNKNSYNLGVFWGISYQLK